MGGIVMLSGGARLMVSGAANIAAELGTDPVVVGLTVVFQGSGTITLTSLTATSTAGTFNYTAPLVSGTGTPATRVVTNGRFNVTL